MMSAKPGFVRKLRRNVQDYGCRVTIRKSAAYLASPIYERTVYRIYAIDLRAAPLARRADTRGIDYSVLNGNNDRMIDQIEDWAEWLRGELKARLAAGAVCVVASRGERLAGFNLVAPGEVHIPLLKLTRTFRQGTAWSEHIAVGRDFRGQGIATELRLRIFEALRRRGIKKLYGGTLASNTPALGLARKLGFRELADVTYTGFLGRRKWTYRRCPRRSAQDDSVAVSLQEPQVCPQ